jgi:hypothetical protein
MAGLGEVNFVELVEEIYGADLETLEVRAHGRTRRRTATTRGVSDTTRWRGSRRRRSSGPRATGPAVVVAQSVAESYYQAAIDALFAARGAEAVASAVRRAARSFSLKNRAHRRIYGARSLMTSLATPTSGRPTTPASTCGTPGSTARPLSRLRRGVIHPRGPRPNRSSRASPRQSGCAEHRRTSQSSGSSASPGRLWQLR